MGILHDIEMTTRIKLALFSNPHVGGFEISVHTVNGIVFLNGFVQDDAKKMLAEKIARSLGGMDIKNDIKVLGDEGMEEMQAVAESESDDAVRARIIGDMESDSRVNALMVNVEVSDGVVSLSGLQDSDAGRLRAQEIASRVEGIREVVNEIEVRRAA